MSNRIELYDNYEHWYHAIDPKHYGVIWLYADPHFDDQFDENWMPSDVQVEHINEKVGRKDTIIFLGDIGNVEWIKKVHGYKVLLTGNHDVGKTKYKKKYCIEYNSKNKIIASFADTYKEAKEIAEYMKEDLRIGVEPKISNNGLFDEVYDGPLFINKNILLSHEPIELSFGLNIHGHCHGVHRSGSTGEWSSAGHAKYNVVSDLHDFRPIRLDEIVSKYKVKDLHRITIDKANKKEK